MINQFGCCARYYKNAYKDDVLFAEDNGFSFLQLMYNNKRLLNKEVFMQADEIKRIGFPGILHACLDINEIEGHSNELMETVKYLGHKEVILHPICRSEKIVDTTIFRLSKIVRNLLLTMKKEGISLFLENNSKLDPIFSTTSQIDIMFKENPDLEFVLDVAHIDNYAHLEEMVNVKYPMLLHITDRKLEEIHNHVPIGQGNIDFKYIFNEILPDYRGKIIIEVFQSDEDIINSKKYINQILTQ
mgnify:CR=1 FL=1